MSLFLRLAFIFQDSRPLNAFATLSNTHGCWHGLGSLPSSISVVRPLLHTIVLELHFLYPICGYKSERLPGEQSFGLRYGEYVNDDEKSPNQRLSHYPGEAEGTRSSDWVGELR